MIAEKTKAATNFFRPPVVTVVGHIDHGKTSLLDRIRSSSMALKEAGGITQHIGASLVEFKTKSGDLRKITFIDTPGHAAFNKMRVRGIKITDLVILVVAADVGVQEQTKESFKYIEAAGSPFLVAINKIDLSSADVGRVKGQLAEIGIVPEDYGGKVVVVPVSAKTGQGIDDLLEMVTLMADLEELKAQPEGDLIAVVIESTMDRKKGPIATVLVKNGTLKRGEIIFAGTVSAKIKLMRNWLGEVVEKVDPGEAVEIMGFETTPAIGTMVTRVMVESEVKQELKTEVETTLKIVVKADVQGSLEALISSLPPAVEVINAGVGEILDSDVFLAQTTNAYLFGFNVKVDATAKKVAEQNGLPIFSSRIIYEILAEIEKIIKEKADPLSGKEIFGKAKIIAQFKIQDQKIAGCKVTEGEIARGRKIFIFRGGKMFAESIVASMRHIKDDIDKASIGDEFGAVFSPPLDFKIGDDIISHSD